MMAVAVDITPQVSARRVLEQARDEREALLRELTKSARAKDEFLAMLGHELRNPLAPILTALQLMHLRGVEGAEKERAVIEHQVKHVVRLVDDLLDVSRITRGKIQLKIEHLQLNEVVAKAIEMASPVIEQRLHRLTVDVPPDLPVDGDSGRLSQVIANVLTNAAKYTDPGGDIRIRAEARDSEVWLSIRDSGVGIEPAMLRHIFEPFTQERQDSDRSQGGLGLGLAIVKSLVHAHGGTVVILSEGRGLGSECVIRLPFSAARTPRALPASRRLAVPAADGVKVLLVDDNRDAADMLAESLRALGHSVQIAHDGPQALEIASRDVPDVALLDIGLPVIDGYEVLAQLRSQTTWKGVRTIALTGYGLQNDRDRTKEAGFDDHLVKPVDVADVDAKLRLLRAARPLGHLDQESGSPSR
jgi:CheY-like chemotaxis protein